MEVERRPVGLTVVDRQQACAIGAVLIVTTAFERLYTLMDFYATEDPPSDNIIGVSVL